MLQKKYGTLAEQTINKHGYTFVKVPMEQPLGPTRIADPPGPTLYAKLR